MAIIPESQYPGKIAPADAEYPYGKARNITLPGDGTGTPWEAALVNDLFGFLQSLLSNAGAVPTGTPDKVGASQYLDALARAGAIRVQDDNTALKDISGRFDGDIAMTASYSGGAFGGNTWVWDADSTTAEDGGTVIQATDVTTGRWLLRRREYQATIDNAGQETGEQGVLTVYQRSASEKVGIDSFNFSGVDPVGGTHTSADGNYAQVMHHYNDKTAVIWDYVGREAGSGNTVLLMRMAHNESAAGHNETGTGYFQRFERTVLFDPNFTAPDNRTLAGFKQVDLFDLGLSGSADEWAFVMHGRDASLTGSIGRSYIQQPIHFWTYGNGAGNGAEGVKVFSDTLGGDAVKVQTKSDSLGRAISVNHSAAGEPAVVVDNYVPGSSPSFVSVSQGIDGKDHFAVQQTVDQTNGFAFKISDSLGNIVGGIGADGKNLFLTDKGDGTLRAISVTNGVIGVA